MLRHLALCARPTFAAPPRAALRPVALALLLGACAQQGAGTTAATSPAAPPIPTDPIVAFAAQAAPGTQSSILLADGRPASVRIARSYVAASGRECRDVLVGTGTLQRSQLVCQTEAGGEIRAAAAAWRRGRAVMTRRPDLPPHARTAA